jgi:hypothetical protein
MAALSIQDFIAPMRRQLLVLGYTKADCGVKSTCHRFLTVEKVAAAAVNVKSKPWFLPGDFVCGEQTRSTSLEPGRKYGLQFALWCTEFNNLDANLGPSGLHLDCTLLGKFSSLSANQSTQRRTSLPIALGTLDSATAAPWWCHMV